MSEAQALGDQRARRDIVRTDSARGDHFLQRLLTGNAVLRELIVLLEGQDSLTCSVAVRSVDGVGVVAQLGQTHLQVLTCELLSPGRSVWLVLRVTVEALLSGAGEPALLPAFTAEEE